MNRIMKLKNRGALLLLLIMMSGFINAQNNCSIVITIKDGVKDTVNLKVDNNYLGDKQQVIKAPSSGGEFHFNFKLDRNRVAELSYYNQSIQIYLEPGDDLTIIPSGGLDSTVVFSGKAGANNKFLNLFNTKFKKDYDTAFLHDKILNDGIDPIENFLFDSKKNQKDFCALYPEKANLTESFKQYMDNTMKYYYYGTIYSYPIIRGNSDKDIKVVTPIPSIMIEKVDDKLANNPDAIICETYRNFLIYYITYVTSVENKYNKFTDYTTSMDKKFKVAGEHLNGTPYLYFVAKFMYDTYEKVLPSRLKFYYNDLVTIDKSKIYAPHILAKCGKRMNEKDPVVVKQAETINAATDYKFKLVDLKGNQISMGSFKGKVVYIDFWASWCGPCRAEMPFSKALHEKLSDKQKKNMVFLYISIDANEENWKKAIEQLGIEGVMTISPGNWSSEAVKFFGFNSIPHYMIMDKKGIIVDKDAKRPSNPALMDDLNRMLE